MASRRRSRRMQSRGVIGDFIKAIPAIGWLGGPVGAFEDFILRLNKPKATRLRAAGRAAGRMAVASANANASYFRTYSRGTDMHVEGRDLVTPIPNNLASRAIQESLFSVIPANPAYWTGTRIAQLAPGY